MIDKISKVAWISEAQSGDCVIRCEASQIQISGALGLMVAIVMEAVVPTPASIKGQYILDEQC